MPSNDQDRQPVVLDLKVPATVLARQEEGDEETLPLRRSSVEGPALRGATDRRYLLRALKLGFTELSVTAPDRPLLCRQPRRIYLWMPLDLSEVRAGPTRNESHHSMPNGNTPNDRRDALPVACESDGLLQRKSLANEIDRLDGILDGLDEALAGAVEMAVRDVTGKVVREAVEATLREVLSNPELIRSAAAHHVPVATAVPQNQQPRGTLKDWFKQKLAWLFQKASDKATQAKRYLGSAWKWCVEKLAEARSWLWARGKNLAVGCKIAWKFRKTTAVALTVSSLVGVGAYFSGPEVASALCGLGGALMTVAGTILWPLCRLLFGGNDNS